MKNKDSNEVKQLDLFDTGASAEIYKKNKTENSKKSKKPRPKEKPTQAVPSVF